MHTLQHKEPPPDNPPFLPPTTGIQLVELTLTTATATATATSRPLHLIQRGWIAASTWTVNKTQ